MGVPGGEVAGVGCGVTPGAGVAAGVGLAAGDGEGVGVVAGLGLGCGVGVGAGACRGDGTGVGVVCAATGPAPVGHEMEATASAIRRAAKSWLRHLRQTGNILLLWLTQR